MNSSTTTRTHDERIDAMLDEVPREMKLEVEELTDGVRGMIAATAARVSEQFDAVKVRLDAPAVDASW